MRPVAGQSGAGPLLPPFAPDEAYLETFQILSRALQEQRTVQFLYKNLGADKAQTRRVHRYHLACVENRRYLVAHDPARKGMRNFAMTRMRRGPDVDP